MKILVCKNYTKYKSERGEVAVFWIKLKGCRTKILVRKVLVNLIDIISCVHRKSRSKVVSKFNIEVVLVEILLLLLNTELLSLIASYNTLIG